uniref:Urease ) n=1 Tax=Ganoderma boninense TaxID=34458 RepID=A0A5K1JXH5_9APHY|nr:Urease (EC (Urea amidohydrolase) [Ganoderma boninense]
MATTFAPSPLTSTQSTSRQQFLTPHSPPQQQRRLVSRQRFVQDFSQCLFEFVVQLLPTTEEMAVKEDVRKLLERLIRTIEPDSRLLSFGSSANGFSLKNSGASALRSLGLNAELPLIDL